jgi:hypothetical protein
MTGPLLMLRILAALDRAHRTAETVAASCNLCPAGLALALAEGRRLGFLTPDPTRPAPRIAGGRVLAPERGAGDLPALTPAGRAWAASILAPLGGLLEGEAAR